MFPRDCVLIIPASGFSKRFGAADKLLADVGGRPLADYAAQKASQIGFAQMIAVLPPECSHRAEVFKARGFDAVINTSPALGQAHSIMLGAKAIKATHKGICIMLADMPLVPLVHIRELIDAAPEDGVIKTLYKGHTQPPAVFAGKARDGWLKPANIGKRVSYLPRAGRVITLPLGAPYGDDVDTAADAVRIKTFLEIDL